MVYSINPRIIHIHNKNNHSGDSEGEFKISNTSLNVDHLILFTIHRSDPKVVSFSPKRGIVESGNEITITVKFIDFNINSAKLLVKLISIHRDVVSSPVSDIWINYADNVIKKVVEIKYFENVLNDNNSEPSNSFTSESLVTNSSMAISPMPSSNIAPNIDAKLSQLDFDSIKQDLRKLVIQKANGSDVSNKLIDNQNEGIFTSIVDNIMKSLDDFGNTSKKDSVIKEVTSHQSQLQESMHSNNIEITQDKESQLNSSLFSKQQRSNDESFSISRSYLKPIVSTDKNQLLSIEGEEVDNDFVYDKIKSRLDESIQNQQRIVGIEVSNAMLVSSLSLTIGRFSSEFSSSNTLVTSDTDIILNSMRSFILQDNIKYLSITSTSIISIDSSLNFLTKLQHLDLSQNNIESIESSMTLSNLLHLNISHNRLTSLDFLQELISLKTLLASSNRLSSLSKSVNMLVSLGKTLCVLDLSFNPVSLLV